MQKLKIAVTVAALVVGAVTCDDQPIETASTHPPAPGTEVDRDVPVLSAGARVTNEDLNAHAAAPESVLSVPHSLPDRATSRTDDAHHDSDEAIGTVDGAPRQLPHATATATDLNDGR